MSPLTRALLTAALTLPLVAFVIGGLASPDEVAPDRTRPVIIGRVSEDDAGLRQEPRERERRDDRSDRERRDDREDRDDDPQDPVTDDTARVVAPAPRVLDDEDDGGGDDGDDGDDESGDRSHDGSGDRSRDG